MQANVASCAFPQSIFDAHFHIIDDRYSLQANAGYMPDSFTCGDYLECTRHIPIVGGAVVSGSFQGFDQTYLVDALTQLGPSFIGVTQLPRTVTDAEILRLDVAGVRAVRFNLRRGGSESVEHLAAMAHRVHALAGWHVELYVDSAALSGLFDMLVALPSVSVDHLGLSKKGFATLLKLAEQGVRVKATGFGRTDLDVRMALRDLHAANPAALLFGTDLPSTRAPKPFSDWDVALVADVLGDEAARRVFWDNAIEFYGLAPDARRIANG